MNTAVAPARAPSSSAPAPRYAALGRRIAQARLALRWPQREAAGYCDIGAGTWANYESGIARPSRERLRRIARLLDVDYHELAVLADYEESTQGQQLVPVSPASAALVRAFSRLPGRVQRLLLQLSKPLVEEMDAGAQEEPEQEPDDDAEP